MNKADLIKAIAAIDPEVDTKGKGVEDLEALLAELENAEPAEDTATKEAAEKKAARLAGKTAETKKPPFYVAPGKALTSKRGILSGDTSDEVKAEYLSGGEKALAAFVESGHVLKG